MIWAVVTVSGFVSIGLEVIWFRLLLQFVATTTHAFTAMLATVLAGLAIGGLVAAWILARDRDWFAWVASTQAAAGVAAVASMNALMWTHERGWHSTGIWYVVIIAILPAAVLMGAGFPLALGIATGVREGPESTAEDRDHENASRVGRLYAGNTGRRHHRIARRRIHALAASRKQRRPDRSCHAVRRDRAVVVVVREATSAGGGRVGPRAHGAGGLGPKDAGSVSGRHRMALWQDRRRDLASTKACRQRPAFTPTRSNESCISTGCTRRTTSPGWSDSIGLSGTSQWSCTTHRPTCW